MKKILSLILALVATTTLWAYDFQSGDLYYNITSSSAPYTVEVIAAVSSITTATIPETVYYNGTTYSVTSIGSDAFRNCSSLTSITIPNSVTSIGWYAFFYCSALTSITIPNSVTSIGNYAFNGCKSLTSITIPNSVTSIGGGAFSGCDALPVENNLRYADTYLVEAVDETLSTYSIKEGTKWIGDGAFFGCSALTSITIPNSVTSIGSSAFSSCSKLTSVTIGSGVEIIGEDAFRNCYNLTEILVDAANPNYSSENGILYNKDKSQIIHIPQANNSTSITIPQADTLIDVSVLYNLTKLENIFVAEGNTHYSSVDGVLYNKDKTTLISCPRQKQTVTIPNSVTSIGSSAFSSCSKLTSITIPNSVTSIGSGAFYGCSSLPVENNLRYADTYLVEAVDETLSTYSIKEGTKWIGDGAFFGCSALTSITIPNSVTSIGNNAFRGCSSLPVENNLRYADTYLVEAVDKTLSTYSIKEGTKWIGDKAFEYCSSLTSITIPNSVTSIGDNAFYYCDALDTICIEATTPPILGSSIFSDSIAICYIPCLAKAMYIASKWANYVELFAEYDFEQTSGVCGEQLYWNYANAKLTITGDGAMFDDHAQCIPWNWLQDSIKTIELNEGITHIADDSFNGCAALREITLPASLKVIGSSAFANCPRIYEVTCLAPEPPIADASSFTNYDAYFHAYCDAQRYYSVDPVWKRFHNVECIVNENTVTNNVTITPSDCEATVVWLSNDAAAAYSLVITRNGVTFCTLRFNKYGQLTNISFAPSRTHNQQQAAESTETGYSFTITGLDAGTKYDYQFSVLNDSNESIDEYFGEFTTQSNTSNDLENVGSQLPMTDCQKILRDGQLLILRDGKTYTVMGAEVK